MRGSVVIPYVDLYSLPYTCVLCGSSLGFPHPFLIPHYTDLSLRDKSVSTSSSRTISRGIRPCGGGAAGRGRRDWTGTALAGGAAGRAGGNPASRRPPGSRIRPRPAAPRPPLPGGRGFRSSPAGRRRGPACAPSRSAPNRTWVRARSRPARHRIPSGDTAACFHNTYTHRPSIAAPKSIGGAHIDLSAMLSLCHWKALRSN